MNEFKKAVKSKYGEDINTSFEVIGDIAILELKEHSGLEKQISKELLKHNKNINVVLNKIEDIQDKYRVGKYKITAKRNKRDFTDIKKEFRPQTPTETVHKENGYRLKLDPTKAYFSSKLAYERLRITQLVKENEKILVLFAGIGPFAICIAKYKNVDIIANEMNSEAVRYFRQNIKINKLKGKITIMEGDAKDIMNTLKTNSEYMKFDRIIMPAPKDAPNFFEQALNHTKKGTYIHLYSFADQDEIQNKIIENKILEISKKTGKKIKIMKTRICGNIGVRQHRMVLDIEVL